MKFLTYFVGFLMIGSGLIWMNYNFELVQFEFPDLSNIWPLALVFIGIAILKIPNILRNIASAIAGLVMAISLLSSILSTDNTFDNIKIKVQKNYEEDFDEEEYFNF